MCLKGARLSQYGQASFFYQGNNSLYMPASCQRYPVRRIWFTLTNSHWNESNGFSLKTIYLPAANENSQFGVVYTSPAALVTYSYSFVVDSSLTLSWGRDSDLVQISIYLSNCSLLSFNTIGISVDGWNRSTFVSMPQTIISQNLWVKFVVTLRSPNVSFVLTKNSNPSIRTWKSLTDLGFSPFCKSTLSGIYNDFSGISIPEIQTRLKMVSSWQSLASSDTSFPRFPLLLAFADTLASSSSDTIGGLYNTSDQICSSLYKQFSCSYYFPLASSTTSNPIAACLEDCLEISKYCDNSTNCMIQNACKNYLRLSSCGRTPPPPTLAPSPPTPPTPKPTPRPTPQQQSSQTQPSVDNEQQVSESGSNSLGLIVGIVVGAIVLFIIVGIVIVFVVLRRRRNNKKRRDENANFELINSSNDKNAQNYQSVSAVASKKSDYLTPELKSSDLTKSSDYLTPELRNSENDGNGYLNINGGAEKAQNYQTVGFVANPKKSEYLTPQDLGEDKNQSGYANVPENERKQTPYANTPKEISSNYQTANLDEKTATVGIDKNKRNSEYANFQSQN